MNDKRHIKAVFLIIFRLHITHQAQRRINRNRRKNAKNALVLLVASFILSLILYLISMYTKLFCRAPNLFKIPGCDQFYYTDRPIYRLRPIWQNRNPTMPAHRPNDYRHSKGPQSKYGRRALRMQSNIHRRLRYSPF